MDSENDHQDSVPSDLVEKDGEIEKSSDVISDVLADPGNGSVQSEEVMDKDNECEIQLVQGPTERSAETEDESPRPVILEGLEKITEKMDIVNSGLEKTPDCGRYLTVSVELSPDSSEGESTQARELSKVDSEKNGQSNGLPSSVTNDPVTKLSGNSSEENVAVVSKDVTHTAENNSVAESFGVIRYGKGASLVAEYRSDSESFDSSSDSESSTSTSSGSDLEPAVVEKDSDEEKALKVKPRTKGEILVEDMPPIEDLCITVDERTPLVVLGKVASIVGNLIVIQSEPNTAALDMDSVVFTKDRKSLGQVFETFGPVKCPFYSIRFNNMEQLANKGVEVGTMLYCAPSVPDYTHFVFMNDLIKMKGSDASWENNNEPPPKYLDYSDDEQERLAKGKKNRKRGKEAACDQWPPPDDDDSPDEAPRATQGRGRGRGRGARGRPNRQQNEGQPKPPHQARFGAPPTFPARPMGMPPMFNGPPRFGPGGPPYPWPQRPHASPPPNWMWPPGAYNRGPPPGAPRPGVYSSQADYWRQ